MFPFNIPVKVLDFVVSNKENPKDVEKVDSKKIVLKTVEDIEDIFFETGNGNFKDVNSDSNVRNVFLLSDKKVEKDTKPEVILVETFLFLLVSTLIIFSAFEKSILGTGMGDVDDFEALDISHKVIQVFQEPT